MMHTAADTEANSSRSRFGNLFRRRKWIVDPVNVSPKIRSVSSSLIERDIISILPSVSGVTSDEWNKAILVAKAGSDAILHVSAESNDDGRLVLTADEKDAIRNEQQKLSSQKGIIAILITVALAAFLQGHVQSSINAGSLYAQTLHLAGPGDPKLHDFQLGAMNASPFLTAALLGAPLSVPTNYYIGRRGSLLVSAVLIVASSLASAFAQTWIQLLGVRIIGGVGMGIKAISAPILASESASGFWRGSILLTWQLWVACGIMIGFLVNLVIASVTGSLEGSFDAIGAAPNDPIAYTNLQWILGAPIIPSAALLIAVCFCYESPRFYMREDSPNFRPSQALAILIAIRPTKLQALRDFILIRWSTKDEDTNRDTTSRYQAGLTYSSQLRVVLRLSLKQFRTLFRTPRLRNAIISTCTVALAQQLCGINLLAFYSNAVFIDSADESAIKKAMAYSFGYGAINFFCGLGAMRTIDTAGRRAWLLTTLPIMSLSLMAAAIAFPPKVDIGSARSVVGIIFIFIFTAAYSPGLGPITFTLASESFPLSHREAGASVAIATNLFFAGVLTIVVPSIKTAFSIPGTLGFFSGMNIIAFILVFLLVEETRRLTLEDLEMVYSVSKTRFIRFQLYEWLPYLVKRYVFRRKDILDLPRPQYLLNDIELAQVSS